MDELNPLVRIRELCAQRNWSYYQLAKAAGIPYSTLSTMLHKENMPSLPTLQKLCKGFGISIVEFFEPDKNQQGLTEDQALCLSLFTSLNQEEQKLALAYLKGLSRTL